MENMNKPVVAITVGDQNGVGYEVVLKTVTEPHILEICIPVVYANASIVKKQLALLDEELRTTPMQLIEQPTQAKEGKVSFINCYPDSTPLQIGQNTPEAGAASLAVLQRATADMKKYGIDLLLTAPINKQNIQADDFHFTGHTEYLTQTFEATGGSLMMMVSDLMRIALVTNHVPVAQVAAHITEENVLHKLTLLNKALQQDFQIRRPRIAVLALNPHAGDNGLVGLEENNAIRPAIQKANEAGMMVFGPYSADGFFGTMHYREFDAVLAMYHDQGLIPFKSLDMTGVNFTAGLPIVRTSPDHGVAYDIAGKNQADPTSLRNALYLALEVRKNRLLQKQITANPLP